VAESEFNHFDVIILSRNVKYLQNYVKLGIVITDERFTDEVSHAYARAPAAHAYALDSFRH
jgi:hypothetical protein